MNNPVSLNSEELSTLIEKGDTETIAAILNYSLSDGGIRAKVATKNAYLGILLESTAIPDRDKSIAIIRQQLHDLTSESIKAIKIYGREVGQVTPQWYEEIELKKSTPSNYSLLSLTDWLSQGIDISTSSLEKPESFVDADIQKFLRFHFSPENTALLPLSTIKEVLNISISKIHPVPHMAECLLGIYDYRGEILWLVDLGKQLGLTPSIDSLNFNSNSFLFPTFIETAIDSGFTDTLTVIVIQEQEKYLGLVVPKVIDIEMHDVREIQSANDNLFSTEILPFLQGYLIYSSSPVLNPHALIEDSQLQ